MTACTALSASSCCRASLNSRHSCAFIELTGSRHTLRIIHDGTDELGLTPTYDHAGGGDEVGEGEEEGEEEEEDGGCGAAAVARDITL